MSDKDEILAAIKDLRYGVGLVVVFSFVTAILSMLALLVAATK